MATLFEVVGGDQWFVDLVDRFYDGIEGDELVRPMYPEDLAESRANMTGFLIQFWGGPQTYSEQRGHPRLRMRHAPFQIDEPVRDAWLAHMVASVKAGDLETWAEEEVIAYFDNAATHLINHPGA